MVSGDTSWTTKNKDVEGCMYLVLVSGTRISKPLGLICVGADSHVRIGYPDIIFAFPFGFDVFESSGFRSRER